MNRDRRLKRYGSFSGFLLLLSQPAGALPPPEDIPEERLRSEIIVEARSPVDGRLLTPAQYVQLQAELAVSPPPTVPEEVRDLIFLLRLRRLIRTVIPFL
ncbi:hypothetical protein H6G20_09710 [Desertifilum sp. FACHB-1129]|uniref:Glutathione S-transferase n=1 Tax=Desertifilum tharense IPPAS B-1220 TaxID=1781255 RepID=A0A1E5QG00_9CYAN|nr:MULTISPECIES: hypothetical protein [Desertifilum]MDA0211703.1 hypothetical protein [Cyanobacteria bacterium FC1]MDI9635372.1 hypothetical protein [Geitlerinema splendidum]MBD2311933.1 hypothetical protein [Desertifilum sp. FACHB-1129]MBD2322385.1 hypothetical protein [Desertifilum sp. FACHB-866]MBD2332548.1 hypothetical protein [Desertifilum sp. FACHB-868]